MSLASYKDSIVLDLIPLTLFLSKKFTISPIIFNLHFGLSQYKKLSSIFNLDEHSLQLTGALKRRPLLFSLKSVLALFTYPNTSFVTLKHISQIYAH